MKNVKSIVCAAILVMRSIRHHVFKNRNHLNH